MSRLTGIILENFKAFKHRQVIPIRPLTLIYGPNSAGKSSIIHALALLRHAFVSNGHAEADRVDLGWSEVRLGGWQNLIHGHDGNSTFKIGLQIEADRTPHLKPSEGTDQWEVVWEFGRKSDQDEAFIVSIEATRNGNLEFTGVWCHEKNGWILQCTPHSIHAGKIMPETFAKSYLKRGKIMMDANGKTGFLTWISSVPTPPVSCEGLFPDSKPQRKSSEDEYYESPSADIADNFIKHLFNSTPNDGSSARFGKDWSTDQIKVLKGAEKINGGSQPSPEETTALDEVFNEWSRLSVEAQRPYESAAIAFEAILKDHCHLDSVRERPKVQLNLKDLTDQPKLRPWRELIIQENLREETSAALQSLTAIHGTSPASEQKTGYQLAMRIRVTQLGGDSDQGEPSVSMRSTTRELAIRNPQGLLLGVDDVGYGISTVLPIVTAIHYHKECMISVEQPELHIHPRLQTELGDLLLKSSLENKNTLLVETHSEHLLLRIMRRMRQTAEEKLPEVLPSVRPEDVALLFVSPGPEGSVVQDIGLNERGELIKAWPGGCFEEGFNEMFD